MIMTTDVYEKRIIAYADILGWKNATSDLTQFGRLRAAVQGIAEYARSFSRETKQILKDTPGVSEHLIREHGSIEFSFFSDSFAVSAPVDYGKTILGILAWASHDLIHNKFLVRGGVTIGNLYHNQGIIFGPALVEAVSMGKEACYPRMVCSKELDQYLEKKDYKKKVVLLDRDQEVIVNIALGTLYAEKDLMAIIKKELVEQKTSLINGNI